MTKRQPKSGENGLRLDARRGLAVVEVETKLYPVEAVLGAAYVFVDRCYLRLERAGRGKLAVRLKAKETVDRATLAALAGEFENELLHQALRERLQEQRGRLREYLVARALLAAEEPAPAVGLAPPQEAPPADPGVGADDDYLDDPLGIAVPWEERFDGSSSEGDKGGGEGADPAAG